MAMLHYRQGELSTAREMFEVVLAGEERLFGPEGYDIQVSLTNMALVLAGQGEFDAARVDAPKSAQGKREIARTGASRDAFHHQELGRRL